MPNNAKKTWETYASSWKAKTESERRALYEKALSPDCVYTDPLTRTQGWDELTAYMAQFHEQVPGGHFATQTFVAHHDCSMARWNMLNGKGEILGDGVSYGKYDEEGRLIAMTGFFDVPSP